MKRSLGGKREGWLGDYPFETEIKWDSLSTKNGGIGQLYLQVSLIDI